MKLLKKPAVAIMMMTMAVAALSGCSNGDKTTKSTSSQTDASSKDKKEEVSEGEDSNLNPVGIFPICKEPITVTGIISQPSWISDMIDNDQTRYLEEKSNIKLDLQVVPDEGYGDKLKLALSTGDYPEVIFNGAGNNNSIVTYGIEEQIYIPITEYVNNSMPNLNARFEEMPEIREGMIAPDDNMYILPSFEGMVGHGAVSYKMWMNTEWLSKLNLKMPTTTDELRDVLMAFKNQDPNGNGKADEVPLSGAANTWAAEPYLAILNAFDYFDQSLIKLKDGVFTPCANTDGIKEGLRYLAGLYQDGLLDPASLTQDLAQLGQLGAADPTMLGTFTAGHVGMGIDVANLKLSTDYQHVLPLEGPNGYQGVPAVTKQAINGGPFAITDKCKNPEAVLRMMDLIYAEEFPIEVSPKADWLAADSGAVGVTGLPAKYKQNPNTDFSHGGKNNQWAIIAGGIKDAKLYLQFEGDINDVANYEARLIKATEEYLQYAADADQIMPMWTDPDVALELTNMFTPINDFVKANFVDFIAGTKDIDKDWQAYLDGLEKLGYSQYIEKYSAAYNK